MNVGIIYIGSQIGFSPESIYYDVILIILNLLITLFSLILFGSIVEYLGKEPGVFTIIFSYLAPTVLAYYSGLLRDNVHIATIVILYLAILIYILLAR